MNYLNGGYVMIKHNATQTELKNAYESKKPVIVYDADGRGFYAYIVLNNTTYEIKKVEKKYKHFCQFAYSGQTLLIVIENNSSKNLTGTDITNFIKSLPANALYPLQQLEIKKFNTTNVPFVTAIKNAQSGGAKFKFVSSNLSLSVSNNVVAFTDANEDSTYTDIIITSQYAIEI